MLPKNGNELMLFGASVALCDSFAFVGAPGSIYDNESGKVYVYKLTKDDWIEFQILNGDSASYSDNFGSSLHYNNDRLYIGAPGNNPGPKGAIYIYKNENGLWIKTNKIVQSFASAGEWFGWSIDSDSGRILTGAPHRQIQGKYSAGSGYLFKPVTTNIDIENLILEDYSLSQNYPNPFNPVTTIKYQLPVDGFVTLKVYDILGKEAALLEKQHRTAGSYTVNFDASNLSSGLYIYEIRVNDFVQHRKMMVLK